MQKQNWFRYFLTEKSPEVNNALINLQRSALWIGLALVLQACNEIGHDWFLEYLGPGGQIVPFMLYLGSFLALWQALKQADVQPGATKIQKLQFWQVLILISTIVFGFRGIYEFGRGINQSMQQPPQYWNDGTSLSANAAYLLLEGRDPYSASSLSEVVQRFSIHADWTTPLRMGRFAGRVNYPGKTEIQSVFEQDLRSGHANEFEEKVSYPALSFLPFVPFALFHLENVFPFYVVCYLLILVIAWRVSRPEIRVWTVLLGLANIPMWSSTVGGNIDVLCFLFLLLTWLLTERRWASAICLGLACATKQTAWFFVPFYLILIWKESIWIEALKRLLIAGGVALLINLPFLVWNAHAWFIGMLTPMADPMFPDGVGIISLSGIHLLPYLPGWLYTGLEGLAMLAALYWYWRICRRVPEAAMLLAVIPLFFAWRSLPSYFAGAAYMIFILLAARNRRQYEREKQQETKEQETEQVTCKRYLRPDIIGATVPGIC